MMENNRNDNTPDRILDCAEQLFARKGFDAVSVREITSAAKSNLVAVNYYFGNKTNLYMEVFRKRWVPRTRRIRSRFSELLSGNPSPTTEEVLQALARAFIDGPLSDGERLTHIHLMQRELASPSGVLDRVVNEVMRPFQQELSSLIRSNLPADVTEERLRLTILSILGMILYFMFARPVVSRIAGRDYDNVFKSDLINHITEFSMNGINSLEKGRRTDD